MGFIGFSEDYEKYKQSDEGKYSNNEQVTSGNVLSSDDIEPISDDELTIILESRIKHDATLVFMQPNPDFYDNFYNEEEKPDELVMEARNIRRIYKDYMKYMYAEHIRLEYMERLFEKHGGEERFALMHTLGAIKDWVPPHPTLSRTSDDYELYQRGDLPLYVGNFDPEYVNKRTDEMYNDMDGDNVEVVADVNTNRLVQLNSELVYHTENSSSTPIKKSTNNSISGVSVNELQDLQQLFRSWYHPEEDDKDKTKESKEKVQEVFFKESPDAIRAEYYTAPVLMSTAGELEKIMEQGYYEEEPDHRPEDMIVDPVSHSPMTYAEYCKRDLIRALEDDTNPEGWDSLKLMRHLGVGSSYEIRLLENKKRNKKRRKKKAGDLFSAVAGEGADSVSTLEQLNNLLFDD